MVQGANIETLSWGQRGQPGLLLMHGNSAHADWYSFIAPLLANTMRVVALSFSGMGNSDWRPQYGNEIWADEALAVAEHCGLFESSMKPVFLGHSFGGFPLMNACARYGDRLRLAIIADSPLRTREQHEKRSESTPAERPRTEFKPHRVYERMEDAVARFRLLPPQACSNLYILDHIARTSLKPARLADGRDGVTWKFDPAIFKGFKMGKPGAELLASRGPVAWLNGARSGLIDDKVLDNIRRYSPPGTPVSQVADADHHLMVDQPLGFVEAVRSLVEASSPS